MLTGIFVKESKYRFICDVKIDNKIQECYISNSSHLLPMINLVNKKVLLKENKGKNLRTKYTLHALFAQNEKVLLNLNYVNNLVQKYLYEINDANNIKREYQLGKYKSDFYIIDKNIVIEVKGILSENNSVVFPYKHCERCSWQLKHIINLLKQGYIVDYYLVLLNSQIEEIIINDEIKRLFSDCLSLGMNIKYFTIIWDNDNCSLIKSSKIVLKINC